MIARSSTARRIWEPQNHLEERLGQRPEWAQSQTTHEGKHTSEGQSERSIPLLSAWDIQRLADEDVLGFHRDLPPFRAKRMDWRDFQHLTERTKMPPSLLEHLAELSPILSIDTSGAGAFPECIDLDERN